MKVIQLLKNTLQTQPSAFKLATWVLFTYALCLLSFGYLGLLSGMVVALIAHRFNHGKVSSALKLTLGLCFYQFLSLGVVFHTLAGTALTLYSLYNIFNPALSSFGKFKSFWKVLSRTANQIPLLSKVALSYLFENENILQKAQDEAMWFVEQAKNTGFVVVNAVSVAFKKTLIILYKLWTTIAKISRVMFKILSGVSIFSGLAAVVITLLSKFYPVVAFYKDIAVTKLVFAFGLLSKGTIVAKAWFVWGGVGMFSLIPTLVTLNLMFWLTSALALGAFLLTMQIKYVIDSIVNVGTDSRFVRWKSVLELLFVFCSLQSGFLLLAALGIVNAASIGAIVSATFGSIAGIAAYIKYHHHEYKAQLWWQSLVLVKDCALISLDIVLATSKELNFIQKCKKWFEIFSNKLEQIGNLNLDEFIRHPVMDARVQAPTAIGVALGAQAFMLAQSVLATPVVSVPLVGFTARKLYQNNHKQLALATGAIGAHAIMHNALPVNALLLYRAYDNYQHGYVHMSTAYFGLIVLVNQPLPMLVGQLGSMALLTGTLSGIGHMMNENEPKFDAFSSELMKSALIMLTFSHVPSMLEPVLNRNMQLSSAFMLSGGIGLLLDLKQGDVKPQNMALLVPGVAIVAYEFATHIGMVNAMLVANTFVTGAKVYERGLNFQIITQSEFLLSLLSGAFFIGRTIPLENTNALASILVQGTLASLQITSVFKTDLKPKAQYAVIASTLLLSALEALFAREDSMLLPRPNQMMVGIRMLMLVMSLFQLGEHYYKANRPRP